MVDWKIPRYCSHVKGEIRYWKKSLGHKEGQKALVRSKDRRKLVEREVQEKREARLCWKK